jgi:hypothetical protein
VSSIALVLYLGLFSATTVYAQADEAQLKAAFIFNFAKFATWSGEDGASARDLVLCVAQDQEIYRQLTEVEGRKIRERVIHVAEISNATSLPNCQVIYVGNSLPQREVEKLIQSYNQGALTISDGTAATAIQFVPNGARLGFSVHMPEVKKQGIELNSQLLKLAVSVSVEGR